MYMRVYLLVSIIQYKHSDLNACHVMAAHDQSRRRPTEAVLVVEGLLLAGTATAG